VFLADGAWHALMLLASVVGESFVAAAAAGACREHLANARVQDLTPVEERRPPPFSSLVSDRSPSLSTARWPAPTSYKASETPHVLGLVWTW